MKRRRIAIGCAAALLLALAGARSAFADPNERCLECHGAETIKLLPVEFSDGTTAPAYISQSEFLQSAHGTLACASCHRDFVATEHPGRKLPGREEYALNMNSHCLHCHEAGGDMQCKQIVGLDHPERNKEGSLCISCHSPHTMKSAVSLAAVGPRVKAKASALFSTKGIEYLYVIAYLVLFVPFALLVRPRKMAPAVEAASELPEPQRIGRWLPLPHGFHLHRGHTWAVAEGNDVIRVGMDDFAQRLIGEPKAVRLPEPGESLEQGERGWQLQVNGHSVDLLSPVQGEVVDVNKEALETPGLVCQDPYGRGWLLKLRVKHTSSALKNLMPERMAGAWIDEATEELGTLMDDSLGTVLQDGGQPVSGFARELAGERWPEIAAKFLLTS